MNTHESTGKRSQHSFAPGETMKDRARGRLASSNRKRVGILLARTRTEVNKITNAGTGLAPFSDLSEIRSDSDPCLPLSPEQSRYLSGKGMVGSQEQEERLVYRSGLGGYAVGGCAWGEKRVRRRKLWNYGRMASPPLRFGNARWSEALLCFDSCRAAGVASIGFVSVAPVGLQCTSLAGIPENPPCRT